MPSSIHTLYAEKKMSDRNSGPSLEGGLRGALAPQNLGNWKTEQKDTLNNRLLLASFNPYFDLYGGATNRDMLLLATLR